MSLRWEADGLFVKVCGLGTADDVEVAAGAGADAVGFVYWEPSPRHHDLSTIRRLAEASPVTTVLVTVDLDSASLLTAATQTGVDAVQPHGRHAAVASATARRFGLGVIRPIKAGQELPTETPDEVLLIDTPHASLPGGTGETFDWDTIAHVRRRFLLAGGLDPDNVDQAVRRVAPFGVDASSGLESSPGVKDHARIRDFVKVAKEAHRR